MRWVIVAVVIAVMTLSACGEPDAGPDVALPAATATATATVPVVTTAEASPTLDPSPATTETGITLPTMEPSLGTGAALLAGTLVLRDGCLHVVASNDDPGYLVVWPYRFSVETRDGVATVLDPHGTVVGVEGQPIQIGGGEGGTGAELDIGCDGPVWWAGETYPLGDWPQPPPEPAPPPMAIAAQPAPDAGGTTGTLALDGACLRIATPDGSSRLVVWPLDTTPSFVANELQIARGDGAVVGWIGAELYLTGTPAETVADVEALAPLATPVPEGCGGPFWVTGKTLDLAEFVARDGVPAELTRDPFIESYFLSGAMQRVTLREAIRRATLEEALGQIQVSIGSEHPDTFGGLWVEREPLDPTFRIVFAFTRDGEATLAPYIAGTALESSPDVEVRQVRWSERELLAQQQEATDLLRSVGINASSASMVQDNRVELWVPWVEVAEQALADAGLRLPEAVVLIGVSDLPPPTPAS